MLLNSEIEGFWKHDGGKIEKTLVPGIFPFPQNVFGLSKMYFSKHAVRNTESTHKQIYRICHELTVEIKLY